MTEKAVQSNGIEIWTDAFGDPADEPILLIAGAASQGIGWEEAFCQQLADGANFVIRFDHQDTGRTTCVDYERQPYTLNDMASYTLGILDAYGLKSAHMVGISMGGMIAQILAINDGKRVRTLTSIMSSPVMNIIENEDLPPPSADFMDKMTALTSGSPAVTIEVQIEELVDGYEILAGSLEPFDRDEYRIRATREITRANNYAARLNHEYAMAATEPKDRRSQLANLDIPTLVIHGTEDPIIGLRHDKATADAIPGAELLVVEKLGHEMPRTAWPIVLPALLNHTSKHRQGNQ